MKKTFRTWLVSAAAIAGTAALAPAAWAGCGPEMKHSTAFVQAPDQGGGQLTPAAYSAADIVGMWSVKYYDTNGNEIDYGFVQWHSDGTEILNSATRSPASENFCLGVWQQTGTRRFTLSHWALSYDPSSGQLNGVVHMKEDVVLDSSSDNYSGTVVYDIFDPNTHKRVEQDKGTATGTRVTVATTNPS